MRKSKSPKPNRLPVLLNNRGQGLTEYIILLLLIAVVSIGATKVLGSTIKQNIEQAQRHIKKELTLN